MIVKVVVHCMDKKSIVKATPIIFNEIIAEKVRNESLNEIAEKLIQSNSINNENLKRYIEKQN